MFHDGTMYGEKLTVDYKYYHNTIKVSAFASKNVYFKNLIFLGEIIL